MSDVYQAPAADMQTPVDGDRIERAIAGNYEFSVMDAFAEGRKLSDGSKWKIHKTALLMFVVMIAIGLGFGLVTGVVGAVIPVVAAILPVLAQLAIYLVMTPMMVAFFMMAVSHVSGGEWEKVGLFDYMGAMGKLFVTYLLMGLMIAAGIILLVIPGIYLSIAYGFALILAGDKNMGIWESLEVSRKAMSNRWFSFLGLYMLLGLVNLIGMIPLGIGLIWTIPWSVNTMAVVYRDMFGPAEV
ncbi:Uncharacterised protein [BD1-7 clade bacterium]|uniref:Glycerophosphoryl diester phosphodiesterase membrane domain-containing protein n=1 Tax=BD1-7 clade bacterium TaxID=2029982 RepID=A0A5S9Q3V5_9GAMM|nr:Uncharacterised protein [BD1-7 clade bacterium]CAA0112220.1 Uncharacterised protein [BD1-7 clade bacterium]